MTARARNPAQAPATRAAHRATRTNAPATTSPPKRGATLADVREALRESETIRSKMRDALVALKTKYEALELLHAGCASQRKVVLSDADAVEQVAVARQMASEERGRRMQAEAARDAAERSAREAWSARGAREAAESARRASGEDAETTGDAAKASEELRRELKTTKTTCERLRKENAKLRGRAKTLEEAVLTGDVAALVDGFPSDGFPSDGMPSDGLPSSTKARRGATKKTAARRRADAAESREPPLPVIDEPWTSRPPVTLLPPMGAPFTGARARNLVAPPPKRRRSVSSDRAPRARRRSARSARVCHIRCTLRSSPRLVPPPRAIVVRVVFRPRALSPKNRPTATTDRNDRDRPHTTARVRHARPTRARVHDARGVASSRPSRRRSPRARRARAARRLVIVKGIDVVIVVIAARRTARSADNVPRRPASTVRW